MEMQSKIGAPRLIRRPTGGVLAGLAIAALMAVASPAIAGVGSGSWIAASTYGKVHIRTAGGPWKRLRAGDSVGPATEIITGDRGRAVLVRGKSTITVARSSRIELPATPAAGVTKTALTPGDGGSRVERVYQSFGTMLYRVKPEPGTRFQVKTPYLVTTIKGTVFSVAVGRTGAAVHVSEGLVEVLPTSGAAGALVAAGQTASISSRRNAGLSLRGARPSDANGVRLEGSGGKGRDGDHRDARASGGRVVFASPGAAGLGSGGAPLAPPVGPGASGLTPSTPSPFTGVPTTVVTVSPGTRPAAPPRAVAPPAVAPPAVEPPAVAPPPPAPKSPRGDDD